MTRFRLLLCWFIAFILVACNSEQSDKSYTLELNGNDIYITMPHPTMGIIGINEVDWRGVQLSDVIEDVYQTILANSIYGECNLYVRFIIEETDKYGNKTENYDEHKILSLPIEEVKKYKGSKYLNKNYKISEKIYDAAFNINATLNLGTNIYEDTITEVSSNNSLINNSQVNLNSDELYTAPSESEVAQISSSDNSSEHIAEFKVVSEYDANGNILDSKDEQSNFSICVFSKNLVLIHWFNGIPWDNAKHDFYTINNSTLKYSEDINGWILKSTSDLADINIYLYEGPIDIEINNKRPKWYVRFRCEYTGGDLPKLGKYVTTVN